MDTKKHRLLVPGLLAAMWAVVLVWQGEEHFRVREAAKTDLSTRAKDIANSISACVRGMRFRGTVLQERLEPMLDELINGRTNELVQSSELISIVLLNATGEPVATAGKPVSKEALQQGERWGPRSVIFVNPVDLGATVLPPMRGFTNAFRDGPRPPPRREPGAEPRPGPENTNAVSGATTNPSGLNDGNPPPRRERTGRPDQDEPRPPRRPFWMRDMNDEEFRNLMAQRELHGLALAMSTESFRVAAVRDLRLRTVILGLATLSVLGAGVAWRNLGKSADLQIRLVRASELNSHLKEMNLAAAGLAHETRNPLNIIRGRAQMLSKREDTPPEERARALDIVNETDKVAAQLNEFINYSRPREVRRTTVALTSVVNEVVRALSYDLEEKRIQPWVELDQIKIEADEQLLRQALFNLLLNAVQAVETGGQIQVLAGRQGAAEAWLEVRDNGPGVPPENRSEIFKPYFTTHRTGTGLGLAVVQQIVRAHGWEIQCLPNEPRGATFRLTHLPALAPASTRAASA